MIQDTKEINLRWKALLGELTTRFGKEPTMEAILFLIGVNEYQGRTPKYKFSKEEKQDLMHIAVCRLLSQYDVYSFSHIDDDGWPHYDVNEKVQASTLSEQELLLQQAILDYYHNN